MTTGNTNHLARLWQRGDVALRRWLLAIGVVLGVALAARIGIVRAEEARHSARQSVMQSDSQYRASASSGALSVLTYNVAGLPGMLSSSNPAVNTGRVSPLLNRYDVVVAQEDFSYHEELIEHSSHRYLNSPSYPRSTMFGDGLAVLSRFPVALDVRVRWRACNGYLLALSDCFAEKGFSVTELGLARGAHLVVVNVHADAGNGDGDVAAREAGFDQLADYVLHSLRGRALIVAGDTNLDDKDPRDVAILQRFLTRTGLAEVCRQFRCEGENLDRVLYRSSTHLELDARAWRADRRFVDERGNDLSDHLAMAAEFEWRVLGGPTNLARVAASPGL